MPLWLEERKSLRTGHEVRRKRAATRQIVAAQRASLQEPEQSLTAVVFGDPPPGRSALDQRRLRVVP